MTKPRRHATPRQAGGPGLLRVLAMAMLACLGPSVQAHAQFGFGGYGWGMFQYRSPSVEAINANANIRASAAFSARQGQRLTDPGDRFAYRQQQVSFQDRYNFESRQSFQEHLGRPANPRGTPVATTTRPSPGSVSSSSPGRSTGDVPVITSFINANNQVVWPADSPVEGELGPLRRLSDSATIVVANEFRSQGASNLTSVAEARKRLLDYGRPALATIRAESTQAISDTFHRFLLALYDSLARSAMRDPPPPIPRD